MGDGVAHSPSRTSRMVQTGDGITHFHGLEYKMHDSGVVCKYWPMNLVDAEMHYLHTHTHTYTLCVLATDQLVLIFKFEFKTSSYPEHVSPSSGDSVTMKFKQW